MRAASLLLVAALCLTSAGARAEGGASPRAWRTGLGVGLVALGAGGLGLGLAGVLAANDAQGRLLAYGPAATVTPQDAAQTLPVLTQERDAFTALAVAGFAAGGLLLGAAVTLLVLDGRPAAVAVMPTRDGAFVSFSLRL